jgi:hypothetical protein
MNKESIQEVKALDAMVSIKKRPKDPQNFKKRLIKKTLINSSSINSEPDFVEELKKQIMYGDTGHGILLDEKI